MSKTKPGQRILFAVILILMLVSTIGLYLGSALGIMNPSDEEIEARQEMADFQEKLDAYNAWLAQYTEKYSAIYYEQFKSYKDVNKEYNSASVKELSIKDLKEGDGPELTAETEYRAYYIGWLPDGKVFDSSFDGDKLKSPIEGGNLIEGWKEGVLGMKIGGVRELTIPADKAYGEEGHGDIPANSPIKFVLMAIPPMSDEDKAERPDLFGQNS